MNAERQVALVTGAAAGLGRAIAECYAREGASVMVTDINTDAAAAVAAAISEAGGAAASAHLDTTDPQQHLDLVAQVEDTFGRLDIAANNAGITIPATPTAELPLEDWERVRSVDLDGVFHGVRAYSAAKHGVIGMMQTIAWEYGARGIRALAVGPAYIKGGLSDVAWASRGRSATPSHG